MNTVIQPNLEKMIKSLEAQLRDLYDEKLKSPSIQMLQASLQNLEAQLVDLYAERAELPVSPANVKMTISSLEEQLICVLDEKLELQKDIERIRAQMARVKHKSKVLGAAVMEAALFDNHDDMKLLKT